MNKTEKRSSLLIAFLLTIGICAGIYFGVRGIGEKQEEEIQPTATGSIQVTSISKDNAKEHWVTIVSAKQDEIEKSGRATATTTTKVPNKKIVAVKSPTMTAASTTVTPLWRKSNGVKYTDRVRVISRRGVDTSVVGWAKPSKNIDIAYWKDEVLPYTEDRNHDQYLVIPRLGLVAPLIYYEFKGDLKNFNQKALDKAFEGGVATYPQMAKLGEYGNALIGGHSSYYTRKKSNYKTIFATIPELDPGDEIRWYARKNGKRHRYRYIVTESYGGQNDPKTGKFNTDIVDVDPAIQEMTLYTCIPIGTDRDRRIVKAHMKEERKLDDALQNGLRNK